MSDEDVYLQGDEPPIVDCDVLEAAKENIQPLGTGRRVTALSAILSTPHAQREAKLSATRNRLRINVELSLDDEEGDPLEAYCRLVYWTLENYPQGHSTESGLLELLEEATRVLKDERGGRWRGELKYLKLWLLYASYVERPTTIYKFLLSNDIGTNFALLYEEHAAVLERDGRRKEADEAYALGIARRASPLEHLENRYADFQKRMMSNVTLPTPVAADAAPPSRRALTLTHSLPSAQSQSTRAPVSSASNNSRLQIFVDPSGSESGAAGGTWDDIGTRKTRIKENIPEVKKLAGTTIKQAGRSKRLASGSATASSSKVVIYRDPDPAESLPPSSATSLNGTTQKASAKSSFTPFVEEEQKPLFIPFRDEDTACSPGISSPIPNSVMRVKKEGAKLPIPASEAEALRKDPLKNYGGEIATATKEDN